jgi:hypothetical protein
VAIAATTVWEVRSGGSDQNGGGYSSGGTDWSQQDAAQYSVTDAVTNGTTTITSATANFGTDVVGNVLYIQGGTGSITAGWYQITSWTNATTIVVDRSTGLTTGTGATLKIGGALASPGMACGASGGASGATAAAGNDIWIKSGTYTITSTSNNVSGGRFTVPSNSSGNTGQIRGYQTTRGDLGTKPIIKADGVITTFTICTGAVWCVIDNIEFDGNSRSGSTGVALGANEARCLRCTFKNFTTAGITGTGTSLAEACYATTNSGPAFAIPARYCVAYANTATPFTGAGSGVGVSFCISWGNTGASTDGFTLAGSNACRLSHCVAYGNGRDGFRFPGTLNDWATNCVAYGNTGSGFNTTSAQSLGLLQTCAAGGNGTNFNASVTSLAENSITLTADPFTNAAGGDFSLNSTAGGGAALKALGFPTAFPGISTNNYIDIGAAQAVASASGGIIRTGMNGGFL